MSLSSICNTTFSIRRPTITLGTYGGQVRSLSTVYSNLRGSIQGASGETMERFAKMSMSIDTVIYTPTSIDCRSGDLVVDAQGRTYQVQYFNDMGGRGRAFSIYAKAIDQPATAQIVSVTLSSDSSVPYLTFDRNVTQIGGSSTFRVTGDAGAGWDGQIAGNVIAWSGLATISAGTAWYWTGTDASLSPSPDATQTGKVLAYRG